MKLKTLSTLILCAVSMQAVANNKIYWIAPDGDYARATDGTCVRTILWTEEKSIDGCEGRAEKTAAVKPVLAPVAAMAAVKEVVAPAAPAYRDLSLASGASFALGGSILNAEGKAAVAALLAKFEGETINSVIVEGYTDDRGDAAYNQHLSEQRAQAVKDELVAHGVDASIIKTAGFGESKPIADNNTRDGRAQNRRVTIKVDAKTRQL